ncbi:RIP metalloprotease RseP [Mucilaginibacter sp. UR6-1]|uniref:RIP metalloprotease RseP n=1 Tax=Mucilaginibacter sp. UR6-1 TaxID=1435643 RepID=UPI001E535AF9|nr:RIP metalloprotease RseP [Mucilaginibacter sp. UR6-1]MCC8410070.1 RIP metalloprotease RseP [Mucilaginibacter sp. UR6-1]
MDVIVMIGQLLLGLSILVILHEFGHFIAARAFGIKVEKFYLFFDAWNFSLFKFKYKGVEYGIGWLPLGGYVKIAGMIDESMDTEQMAGEPQPWEFRSKPAWQRLIVMLGGIIVNIIVGIFIFWMLTVKYGETYIPNSDIKYGIVPGTIGEKIGLRAGDKIYAINGKPVDRFDDIISSKVLIDNATLNVQRGDQKLDVTIPADILNDVSDLGIEQFISRMPRSKILVDSLAPNSGAKKAGLAHGDVITAIDGKPVTFLDELQKELKQHKNKQVALTVNRASKIITLNSQVSKEGTIGFQNKFDIPEKTINYSFFASLPIGAERAITSFKDNAKGLGKLFTGKVKATKAVSSPIGIATLYGGDWDWARFWSLTGLLSMVLALMNLLPIPALDGGHALFLLIEMIKGKPLSDKFLERAQLVGFVMLISLMLFAFGNDIFKHILPK